MNTCHEIDWLIRKMAAEKRERAKARAFRSDATQGWVKFTDYLRFCRGVQDWKSVGSYQLNNYYLDYELECLKLGMEYEHPKLYNIKVSLMK